MTAVSLDRYAALVLRYRWPVLVFATLLMVALTGGARFIGVTNDYRLLFEKDNPQLMALDALEATFATSNAALIAIAPRQGSVFTREALGAIEELTKAGWETPYSSRVDSLTNYTHSEADGDDLIVRPLVENARDLDDAGLARVESIALSASELAGRLVARDGRVGGLVINFVLPEKPRSGGHRDHRLSPGSARQGANRPSSNSLLPDRRCGDEPGLRRHHAGGSGYAGAHRVPDHRRRRRRPVALGLGYRRQPRRPRIHPQQHGRVRRVDRYRVRTRQFGLADNCHDGRHSARDPYRCQRAFGHASRSRPEFRDRRVVAGQYAAGIPHFANHRDRVPEPELFRFAAVPPARQSGCIRCVVRFRLFHGPVAGARACPLLLEPHRVSGGRPDSSPIPAPPTRSNPFVMVGGGRPSTSFSGWRDEKNKTWMVGLRRPRRSKKAGKALPTKTDRPYCPSCRCARA